MFSQTTEYAMRAMAWLALSPDRLVPTMTLAQKTKVPPHYLAKVLQQLSAAGLITGKRGVRGGYKLSRPAERITLLDVVRSVAEVNRITSCPLGLETHGTNLCPLHRKADAAAKAIIDLYGSSTLRDLINDPGAPTPLCETAAKVGLTVSAAGGRR
ncbi:MAG TPA: Rrf2 family transcriptional regulator [Phycisphaerales bacterium]|nr:Rrf2 family transcriptional regulator [Phycisphaerales bacterium]